MFWLRRSRALERVPALVLGLLAVGVAVEAVYVLAEGATPLVDDWLHDSLVFGAAVMCALGARRQPRSGRGWMWTAAAIFCVGLGDVLWGLLYDGTDPAAVPYPNPATAFYLASYPMFMIGLVLVVRSRVAHFELHRWLDGLVVVLIVAAPMVALVVEPVLATAPSDPLGHVVALSYPLGDLVLIGALLGAVPLMSWRVDASWCWFGLGLLCLTVGDAVYAGTAIASEYQEGPYDFLWSAGCVAIAIAAWRPTTDVAHTSRPVGWPAIILPLGAQVFALGTQIYAYFDELPPAERLLTAAVLAIGIAQIIVSRPRAPEETAPPRVEPPPDEADPEIRTRRPLSQPAESQEA